MDEQKVDEILTRLSKAVSDLLEYGEHLRGLIEGLMKHVEYLEKRFEASQSEMVWRIRRLEKETLKK